VSKAQALPEGAPVIVVAGHERATTSVIVVVTVLAHVDVGSKNSTMEVVVFVVVVLMGHSG
jgi:hypothetical protein